MSDDRPQDTDADQTLEQDTPPGVTPPEEQTEESQDTIAAEVGQGSVTPAGAGTAAPAAPAPPGTTTPITPTTPTTPTTPAAPAGPPAAPGTTGTAPGRRI